MKSNQTMMAVGAVVVIIIAIAVVVHFLKPAPANVAVPNVPTSIDSAHPK